MFKKILFSVGLVSLFLFVSCTNFAEEGAGNSQLAFGIGDAARDIESAIKLNESINDNTELEVYCGLRRGDTVINDQSDILVLKDLPGSTFSFKNIPNGNNYSISMKISYNNIVIYDALSDVFALSAANEEAKVSLKLKKKNSSIAFDLCGGSFKEGETPPSSYFINSSIVLPVPEKAYNQFDGWYLSKDFAPEKKVESLGKTCFLGDVTLYAKWIENFASTETPKVLKQTTIGKNSYDIVQFGDWPQTKYGGDEKLLTPCINGINAWDKSVCYTDGNGNYYIKEKAKPHRSVKDYTKDTDYYFKLEPIQWRVLTDNYNGKKLLLAEKALVICPYFTYVTDSATRTIESKTVENNNYRHSEIRAFLNGYDYVNPDNKNNATHNGKGFLQKAFTPTAIEKIAVTNVDNSAASTTDAGNIYVCGNTTDKIFLLSEKEVTTAEYGFGEVNVTDTARQRKSTDYVKATGIYDYNSFCDWWLRSPLCTNSHLVCEASYSGRDGFTYGSSKVTGVVPALSISF